MTITVLTSSVAGSQSHVDTITEATDADVYAARRRYPSPWYVILVTATQEGRNQ